MSEGKVFEEFVENTDRLIGGGVTIAAHRAETGDIVTIAEGGREVLAFGVDGYTRLRTDLLAALDGAARAAGWDGGSGEPEPRGQKVTITVHPAPGPAPRIIPVPMEGPMRERPYR